MRQRTCRRGGWVSLAALVLMTVLLAAMALAINAGWLGTARLDCQTAADAAALAATARLIDDEWLRQPAASQADLLLAVRLQAQEYALRNRVLGRPLTLLAEDLAIGSYDASERFLAADETATLDEADVVRVAARQLRERNQGVPILFGALFLTPAVSVQAFAEARLDRDIIGFRARPSRPLPILPLGLRLGVWQSQILSGGGPDSDAFTPGVGFTSGADAIPEVEFTLPLAPDGNLVDGNGAVIALGTGNPSVQIADGVSLDDLAATQGILTLDDNNELAVVPTVGPNVSSAEYAALLDGLETRRVSLQPWILPLLDDTTNIIAFVAVRVVRVEETSADLLTIRLQPAMLAVPMALNDSTRRGTAALLPNPYLARPRLAR
ncbi:MAG: hypothetical protein SNJ75_14585 [Gemmataceae bacterium]